ncbi:hypothetical protein F5Y04DRAFT_289360 [Hypomontagnella monticulosa]|nr:hypothetical protein F5Y04DRAFT_289360 [Hypomontagnella monticulosa]
MAVDIKATADDATDNDISLENYIMIHSKYVPSSKKLNVALQDVLGKGEFEVEMRHNIYNIKSKTKLSKCTIDKICKLSVSRMVSG